MEGLAAAALVRTFQRHHREDQLDLTEPRTLAAEQLCKVARVAVAAAVVALPQQARQILFRLAVTAEMASNGRRDRATTTLVVAVAGSKTAQAAVVA